MTQVVRTFTCFGGPCTIAIDGKGPLGDSVTAFETVRDHLLNWHAVFSRFKPESELCALNRDPAETVMVTPIMARFVQAVVFAARVTDGLVDATLLDQIEEAGYRGDRMRASMSLPLALALIRGRQNGGPQPSGRWREIEVDPVWGTVRRPPGLRFDGGGIVPGLCADLVAEMLEGYDSYAIDCDGDLRVGGGEWDLVSVVPPSRVRPDAQPLLGVLERVGSVKDLLEVTLEDRSSAGPPHRIGPGLHGGWCGARPESVVGG